MKSASVFLGLIPLALLTAVWIVSPLFAQDPRDNLVSLVQLIANPTMFGGKRVILKGYVLLEFERVN